MRILSLALFLIIKALMTTVGSGFDPSSCSPSNPEKFSRIESCPSSTNLEELHKLHGTHPISFCIFRCASSNGCRVIFRSTEGTCYFGTSTELSTVFAPANQPGSTCLSYVRTAGKEQPSTTPTVATTAAPPAESSLGSGLTSKLLMLFDFRQSYENLVNSTKYTATPQGSVTRDSQGAHFNGENSNDCIDVDNDGGTLVSSFLTHTKNFTFFARLTRQTTNTQIYHYFHGCSTNTLRGLFGDRNGKLFAEHVFVSPDARITQESSGIVLSVDNTPQTVSAAAVIARGSLTNFYFDGSFIGQGTNTGSYPSGNPVCLRLGYTGTAEGSLRGRLICYAIAKEALSETELQQLDTFCQSSR